MHYTLKQMRYFLAVAEHGNVTLASEQLFISQPAISNALSQLEECFDAQLLIRHHAKGVSLTPAGRELQAHAKSLLSYAEDIKSHIQEHSTALSGTINVGCFVTVGPVYVPKLMQQFCAEYPEINFKLFEGNIDEINQALLSGRIEVAFVYDLGAQDRAYTVELASLAPVVVLSATHPLARKKKIDLEELRDEPMVILDLPHSREYFQSMFDRYDFKPNIRHRTKSFEMVRSLVANGEGYSILNLTPKNNYCYDGSELVNIPLAEKTKPLSFVISRAAGVKLSKRAEVFIDFCKKQFGLKY